MIEGGTAAAVPPSFFTQLGSMYDTGKWAYNALDAVADTSKWARGVNALSAGGNAASQAKAEGADTSRALLYGGMTAAVNQGTERLFGGIPGLGEGKVTKALGGLPGVSKAVDIVGEGVENALGTVIDPFLKRATYNKNAQLATPKEIGQSALLGMATSTAFQLPSVIDDIAAQYIKGLNSIRQKMAMDDLAAVYEKNVGNLSKFSDENTYADWLHSIGVNETQLNTLVKYNKAKYNNSPEYQLLSGYSRAVEKGDISPLVGFAEYEHTNKLLQESVVGLKIVSDVKIESFATHFIDRVIGQTSTAHSNMRCGVEIADVMDALQNPLDVGPVRVMEDGDIRQTLYGKSASITISVRDKRLIQVNPRRRTTE